MKADITDIAMRFSLLSGPARLEILQILMKGPATVTKLREGLKLAQPLVSYHLGLLRMGGLVVRTRTGRSVTYVTDKEVLKGLASYLAGLTPKK
jgi:DNA-binding transcriptional ArsR family regulator